MLGNDFLTFRSIEKFQIGFRGLSSSILVNN
jgi:hypothetical protein